MNWAAVSVNNKAMPYRHGLVYLDEEVIQLTTLLKLLSQELGCTALTEHIADDAIND